MGLSIKNVGARFIAPCIIFTSMFLICSALQGETRIAPSEAFALPRQAAKDFAGLPSVQKTIEFYQDLVRKNPRDTTSYVSLAQAYSRLGRETGDVESYQRAEACLKKALTISSTSVAARTMLAMVLYSEHRFLEALTLSRKLWDEQATNHDALAIWGDVNLALGNYKEADSSYRILAKSTSGPALLARMAQLKELNGDSGEARSLMIAAVQKAFKQESAASGFAWYFFRLGEFNFNHGHLTDASQMYGAALDAFPGDYAALAGLGKVSAGLGHYQQAIAYYQKAIAIVPQPDFLAALGDLYIVTGEKTKARKEYETVEYIGRLAEINRQIYNRQLVNYYSDHDKNIGKALQLALAELNIRKDVPGLDAAAWAYLKNGKVAEARKMIDQAMRFNTQDARLYYHAGMIAKAQGRRAEAVRLLTHSLEINPHFDLLQAKIARDVLAGIKETDADNAVRNGEK